MYINVVVDNGAKKPTKAHECDAGFDIYSRESKTIKAHSSELFDTGIHFEIPKGLCGFLKSKSGLNCKYGIVGEGVIDSGYTGSVVVKLYNNSDDDYVISEGDKISQIVFLPIPFVTLRKAKKLEETERGNKGFGSTGK